ncbi:uncharacterized protein LOC109539460 isoform X1 [Dendroctonus ponderosae]|uniref:uncharacterized protein LOC109539460 isoform X1 n=1 Tax=Dendroctonus ponderosae TaxID=77166 RepID=UPI0020365610|nr:uncharacterized protein LOC109539460 isoform X1 [Dendroctonus ponderosae]KAH1010914.1 hypothetical protein HUJ05_005142 [Dendroctonus ponderosae]
MLYKMQHPYVSVIKVNGIPILPPVITPQLRKELLNYRQQAIRLQRQLENRLSLKSNTNGCLKEAFSNDDFHDNNYIAVFATPEEINPIVPISMHLSKDLIEVTEYNKDGLKIINNTQTAQSDNISSSLDHVAFEVDSRGSQPFQPRLLRSNSYTLERPSPILMEHLRNEQSAGSPCLANTLKWSSPDGKSIESISNTARHQDPNEVVTDTADLAKDVEKPKATAIEVYQTDISVQQITVNTTIQDLPSGRCRNKEKQNSFFSNHPFDSLEPDSEFLKVLKDVPDEYAHKIIDLLRKQQLEQKQRLERYNHLNNASTANERSICSESPPLTITPNESMQRSNTFSMSPSQSICYTASSDRESRLDPPISYIEPLDVTQLHPTNVHLEYNLSDKNFSKANVAEIDQDLLRSLERERASSVIGASVRGYLIRRLIRTDKVQTLIATVKEVLMCALELHHSDNIDEKDVELHRRLINQLSAALHSFHGIFFDLPIEEQMAIISADRQRKAEKSSRTQSSSRSSSKQRLINTSANDTKVE